MLKISLTSFSRKLLSGVLCINLILISVPLPAYSQLISSVNLPAPGTSILTTAPFQPPIIHGMIFNPEDPLQFDFIVDEGQKTLSSPDFQTQITELVNYFLLSLTVSDDQLWVNLSPNEGDRIIADAIEHTGMGKDLLEQDYLLKQLTASLLSPEEKTGAEFWKRIYALPEEEISASTSQIDTLHKIWIVPETADIYVENNRVVITQSHLKVMLDQDYVATLENSPNQNLSKNSDSYTEIARDVLLPVVEKEINEGKTFAKLRQIYHSMILATWFKHNLKNNILTQAYADKEKTLGSEIENKDVAQDIYNQYIQSLQKGVYHAIREDFDPKTQEFIPRKYFSGGINPDTLHNVVGEIATSKDASSSVQDLFLSPTTHIASVNIENISSSSISPDENKASSSPAFYSPINDGKVQMGDKYTLTATIEDPDLYRSRKVFLHSDRGISEIWNSEPVEEITNINGHTQYSISGIAIRDFNYLFYYENENEFDKHGKPIRHWINEADRPDDNEGHFKVDVQSSFKGSMFAISMEHQLFATVGGQAAAVQQLFDNISQDPDADVNHIIPYIKGIKQKYEQYPFEDVSELTIPFRFRDDVKLIVKKASIGNTTVYALDAQTDDFFNIPYPQGSDEFYQSVLLSRGAIDLMMQLQAQGINIGAVNSSDHHTALVGALMRLKFTENFSNTAYLHTIHNIDYQGTYDAKFFQETGLQESETIPLTQADKFFNLFEFDKKKQINMMLMSARLVTENPEGNVLVTVSPAEARRITEGKGLINRAMKKANLQGILNGISFKDFNPATNKNLKENFSADDTPDGIAKKRLANKKHLINQINSRFEGENSNPFNLENPENTFKGSLNPDDDVFLMGAVGRMSTQKQLDIILDIIEDLLNGVKPLEEGKAYNFILNGSEQEDASGWSPEQSKRGLELAERARKSELNVNLVFISEFDLPLRDLIMGSIDTFLMPSDTEPSGLTQMEAMRFGAVPIVRLTGGLIDTVFETANRFIGFVFKGAKRNWTLPIDPNDPARKINADEIFKAIERAERIYYEDPELWKQIVKNGMLEDNDWSRSSQEYTTFFRKLYDALIRSKLGGKILNKKIKANEGDKITLRVESFKHDDKKRDVYLYSNIGPTREWHKVGPAQYVGTQRNKDLYEYELIAPADSFEYTFIFEYGAANDEKESVWINTPRNNASVIIDSNFDGTVAFVGMESSAFKKFGGVGDVMRYLPKELAENLDKNVIEIIPLFKSDFSQDDKDNLELLDFKFEVPFKTHANVIVKVWKTKRDGVDYYLLDAQTPDFFNSLYPGGNTMLSESIILSRGALEVLNYLQNNSKINIDIINHHENSTALIPLYTRTLFENSFQQTGIVSTFHSTTMPGTYDKNRINDIGLLNEDHHTLVMTPDDSAIDLLSIPMAVINKFGSPGHSINTVSENAAKQFLENPLVNMVESRVHGIPNGLNFTDWNPNSDTLGLEANFELNENKDNIDEIRSAKLANKKELQRIFNENDLSLIGSNNSDNIHGSLSQDPNRFLMANVAHYNPQKQIDIIADFIEDILDNPAKDIPADILINGTGDSVFTERLIKLAKRVKESDSKISFLFVNEHLPKLTPLTKASADITLTPSNKEGGNLGIMEDLRFGALALIRNEGGPADIVKHNVNGFVFEGKLRPFEDDVKLDKIIRQSNMLEMRQTIVDAIELKANDPDQWNQLMITALSERNDWSDRAGAYLNIFQWMRQERRDLLDPGFKKLITLIGQKFQVHVDKRNNSAPEDRKPFLFVSEGPYASGKSMTRRILIAELEKFGIKIGFEHDENTTEPLSHEEVLKKHSDKDMVFYELEHTQPEGSENIDMLIRFWSDEFIRNTRIFLEGRDPTKLKDRIAQSLVSKGYPPEVRPVDLSLELKGYLRNEDYERYISAALSEKFFTLQSNPLDGKANVNATTWAERPTLREVNDEINAIFTEITPHQLESLSSTNDTDRNIIDKTLKYLQDKNLISLKTVLERAIRDQRIKKLELKKFRVGSYTSNIDNKDFILLYSKENKQEPDEEKIADLIYAAGLLHLGSSNNAHSIRGYVNDYYDSVAASSGIGGIDLNSGKLNIRSQGNQIQFKSLNPSDFENLKNIEGLIPVIINVVPVSQYPLLSKNTQSN